MSQGKTAAVPDGRHQRSERSRQAIIDAMMALIEEGNLVPTAQQVSERANVGIRSVFRHFSDMESLYATIDTQLHKSRDKLFTDRNWEGTLEERIMHVVRLHANCYETDRNMFLTTLVHMWRFDVLRKNYARVQRELRKNLDLRIPELESIPILQREAIDAVTSFEMWHRLRNQQRLSKKQCVETIVDMLLRQLKEQS